MDTIVFNYSKHLNTPSDINQHLPTLAAYAAECESIIELGVRGCISKLGVLLWVS